MLDIEQGSANIDVDRIDDIASWMELRAAIQSEELLSQYDAICVDSMTKAEDLSIVHTCQTVKHEKDKAINGIEDYGFGKGFTYNYETFLTLLGDLDSVVRRGKHVIAIAHECVSTVPNPRGEDWIRYEPRLQSPTSGKASIRHKVKEWANDLLYIGYDVHSEDGKGKGAGTRCIYPVEQPSHWAKSRTLSKPIPYAQGSAELWSQLLGRTE